MQLVDVVCYVLRKGKEAQDKLTKDHALYKKDNTGGIGFTEWMDSLGNKGQVYFYKAYRRLNAAKPWLFSKDFPNG